MMAATTSTSTSPPAEAAEMEGAAAPPGAVLLDLDEWVPPMDAEVRRPERLGSIDRSIDVGEVE